MSMCAVLPDAWRDGGGEALNEPVTFNEWLHASLNDGVKAISAGGTLARR